MNIFNTLSTSSVIPLKEQIQKWHMQYLEAKMANLTPNKLIKLTDDKIQVLKHANLWATMEPPVMMELQAELAHQQQHTKDLVQHLVTHIGKLTQHKNNPSNTPFQHPGWMITSPHSITKIHKVMNGKTYVWCNCCHQGHGLWVCTHTIETHQDVFDMLLIMTTAIRICALLLLIHQPTINSNDLILPTSLHLPFLKHSYH